MAKKSSQRPALLAGATERFVDLVVAFRNSTLRNLVPKRLKAVGYHLVPRQMMEHKMRLADYQRFTADVESHPVCTSVTIGIIKDYMYKYGRFEAACAEMGIPYKLIDITRDGWIQEVRASGCHAFVVWPAYIDSRAKKLYDERLRVLVEDLEQLLFPSYKALWLYESKHRIRDWLDVHDVPHPRTWVFADRTEAEEFVANASYPLVFKTDVGSSAFGVRLLRSRRQAMKVVRACFGKGFLPRRHDRRDRAWGTALFQEYVPDVDEWRVIRLADSYFGYQKLKEGQFHSGSHLCGWYTPPVGLLELCRRVTEIGPFYSMSLDVFETPGGEFLVNELHPVFGPEEPSEMYVDGTPGRYLYDEATRSWRFEEGCFNRRGSCPLRLAKVLQMLGEPLPECVKGWV